MNLRTGFKRIALVASVLILMVGIFLTIRSAEPEINAAQRYAVLADETLKPGPLSPMENSFSMKAEDTVFVEVLQGKPVYSISDIAGRVKAKFPQYKDMSDEVLVEKLIAKYPVYANWLPPGIDPQTGVSYRTLERRHRTAYWGAIRKGVLVSFLTSSVPWLLFGVGIFIMNGFDPRKSNPL